MSKHLGLIPDTSVYTTKMSNLKANCPTFLHRLMPIAFYYLIPNPIWNTITELCHFFRDVTSTSLVVEHGKQLEKDTPLIMCKLKKILPPSFFDSMENLPVHDRWMYPFQRFI